MWQQPCPSGSLQLGFPVWVENHSPPPILNRTRKKEGK